MRVTNKIAIENARIGFRNFSGKEGKFNPAGKRNFCVFLDKEDDDGYRVPDEHLAGALERDGWNVRYLNPREDGDPRMPYLQVAVKYDNIPPRIVLITSGGKTTLDESEIGMLDWAEIDNVDLVISPYNYNVNGKEGVKAYLKNMYVTIEEDEFESKYVDVPDSAANSLNGVDDDIPF